MPQWKANENAQLTLQRFCYCFFWCPCMAINVSVQHNGGCLPDIILSTQGYYHRGTRFQRGLWKLDGCGEVSPRIVSVRWNTEETSAGRLVLRQKDALMVLNPRACSQRQLWEPGEWGKDFPQNSFCTIEYWGDPR